MAQLSTNLHNSSSFARVSDAPQDILTRIKEQIKELGSKFPDLMTSTEQLTGRFRLKELKQQALKKLNGKRKKFRLALESLGWGTLADLLDSAFCGEKLNIWV